jgi:sulfotransferase family protein
MARAMRTRLELDASSTAGGAHGARPPLRAVLAIRKAWQRVRWNPRAVVVSYPKSGRSWLRYMLDRMDIRLHYTHDAAENLPPRRYDELVISRRLLGKRVIFLMRDPRDTAVSAWFHETRRNRRFRGELSDFLRDPYRGLEKILCFNLMWLGAADRFEKFATLTYEDLHSDAVAELKRIARFVGEDGPDDDRIAAAIEAARFDNMHRLEASGEGAAIYGSKLAPADPDDADSYKTRRGIVGGWRDYFSPGDEAFADEVLRRYRPAFGRLRLGRQPLA